MRQAVRGLYRRADAEAWSYDFVVSGHRFCGTTGLTSRREAEQWLARFRAEKESEVAQLSGRTPMSFGAASTRWWQERGQHRKDARTLEGALAWLQPRIGLKTPIARIDDNMLSRLVSERRVERVPKTDRPISPATVNRTVTEPLRAILSRAKLWGQPVADIRWGAHKLKEAAWIVREASADEETRAFAALPAKFRPICKFLIIMGWRRAEACRLQWSDIDLETGFATIRAKGGVVLRKPLPAAAVAIIAAERGQHPTHVFSYTVRHPSGGRRGDRKPITPGSLSTAWIRMRAATKIKGLRLHDLRHTTATRVLRVTGNLMAAGKALGHARISTTQRYAHLLAEDLRDALNAAAPVASPVESPAEARETQRKA